MIFPTEIIFAADRLLETCRGKGLRLGAAESCTGGLVMAALTEIPGSSDVVKCGFVVYENAAKIRTLGVGADTLLEHGAVSAEVVAEMARGAVREGMLDLAVAVTGIAGPVSDSTEKPVGLVHFAVARRLGKGEELLEHREEHFGSPGRPTVRLRAVETALAMLQTAAETYEES